MINKSDAKNMHKNFEINLVFFKLSGGLLSFGWEKNYGPGTAFEQPIRANKSKLCEQHLTRYREVLESLVAPKCIFASIESA